MSRVTTACLVTNARMRISPPHLGHTSTSTSNTLRSSSAQRRRRALSAGHAAPSRSVSSSACSCPAPASTTPRRRHQPRRRVLLQPVLAHEQRQHRAPPRLGEHRCVVRGLRHEAAVTTEPAVGDDEVKMRMPMPARTRLRRSRNDVASRRPSRTTRMRPTYESSVVRSSRTGSSLDCARSSPN